MDDSSGDVLKWPDFLKRIVQGIDARGGGLWLVVNQEMRLGPVVGHSPTDAFSTPDLTKLRQQVLTEVLKTRQPKAVDIDGQYGPTAVGSATILIAAVSVGEQLAGAIEIVHQAQMPQQQRQGLLQYLERSCRLPALESRTAAQPKPATGSSPSAPVQPTNVQAAASHPVTQFPSNAAGAVPPTPPVPPEPQVVRTPIEPTLVTSPMTGKPVQNVKSVPTNASMSTPPAPVDWPILLTWLRRLEEARRLKDVASFIANDGRLLFGADRVSIAVPHGRRAKIVAVSGQDKVHHRSNLTKSMARLAKLVMATKEPFQFNGGVENLPPPLEQPLAEFTQLGGARYVLIIPLLTPKSFDSAAKPADGSEEKPSDRIVQGALIVEQMQQSQPTGELTAYLDLVRDHIGAAIHHARSTESIFLLPVWIWIGHWWSALRGRRLAWTMIALVATIIVSIAMVIIPWDYRVDANGALMPVTQRDVFAPWDGQVVELHVNGGDKVEAGQELLRLRNDELEAERVKSESELNEKLKSVVALQAELDNADKKGDQNEVTRIQGKQEETRIAVNGIRQRLVILKDRIERLTVRSPIAGIVTTFQADQLLTSRPVQRGEVLLQVMDDRGKWQLELEVAEQRLGHLLAARDKLTSELPITYRLLTRPEASHTAKLSLVGTRSNSSEKDGTVIQMRAVPDEIKNPQIGARVRARISCGEKPLGYCLFGDVIEFVQRYLWW